MRNVPCMFEKNVNPTEEAEIHTCDSGGMEL